MRFNKHKAAALMRRRQKRVRLAAGGRKWSCLPARAGISVATLPASSIYFARRSIMSRLVFATAQALARAILQRQVSAVEVLEAHLAQITRHNPALNAIVTLDEEGARRRAQAADDALAKGETWGPLHGVPITLKD